MLAVFNMFYHAWLGLQVVIEDYIAKKSARVSLLICIQGAMTLCGALCLFAILKVALG